MKRVLVSFQFVLLFSALAIHAVWAQTAVVRRNSNLRSEPSQAQAPMRLLTPPETVTLPGSEFRNGYYKVQTSQGESGWAWARNLKITSAAAPGSGATTTQVQSLQATNLRSDASTRQPPMGMVEPGANLALLSPEPVNGYYKVRTPDGREGWIWSQNVAVVGKGTAEAKPEAAAAVVPPPVPTIEKPKPAPTVVPPTVAKAAPATATEKAAAAPTESREEAPPATATAVPPPKATATVEKVAEAAPPAAAPAGAEGGLKPGDMLDRNSAHLAKNLLPPEILGHYERGEYTNKVIAWDGNPNWEKAWVEASKENVSRLTIDETNTIIDKSTGQQPAYFYGIPFPTIDEKDPSAGAKVVWNTFLATWYGGSSWSRTKLIMLNYKGVDRELTAEGSFEFYDGQAPKYRRPNPQNLMGQFLAVAMAPADVQGTASLSWRYRDPKTRDAQWAFVPALRRVRAISPANRSDGFLGSDTSADDGYFFDGKPQDFKWRLVGKQDAYVMMDPEAVNGTVKPRPIPNKQGWSTTIADRPNVYGWEISGWSGVPWAAPNMGLVRRPVYIVEGIPNDKYYLYGKIVLWIDAQTWSGAWHQKFSWGGEHVMTYQVAQLPNATTPTGDETVPVTSQAWDIAENFKMRRASAAGVYRDKMQLYRRVEHDPSIFESGALMRFGK